MLVLNDLETVKSGELGEKGKKEAARLQI